MNCIAEPIGLSDSFAQISFIVFGQVFDAAQCSSVLLQQPHSLKVEKSSIGEVNGSQAMGFNFGLHLLQRRNSGSIKLVRFYPRSTA